MLLYIIDAYNVLHKIPSLCKSDNPQIELIQYIKQNKITGSRNNKVIIVFDGWARMRIIKEDEFEVVFSCDKSADDIIKERIDRIKKLSKYPLSEVIVVSDDREIRDYAKRQGVVSKRIGDFLKVTRVYNKSREESRDISYPLQKEINDELRRIWLKE